MTDTFLIIMFNKYYSSIRFHLFQSINYFQMYTFKIDNALFVYMKTCFHFKESTMKISHDFITIVNTMFLVSGH